MSYEASDDSELVPQVSAPAVLSLWPNHLCLVKYHCRSLQGEVPADDHRKGGKEFRAATKGKKTLTIPNTLGIIVTVCVL